jgi:O-antigen/teichoic acid export membrane protein
VINRSDRLTIGHLMRAFAQFSPSLVVPGIANLLLYPLISRLLSLNELGAFALASGIVAFAPILCSNWLEAAILRYGYRDGEALSHRDWRRASATALILAGVMTAILVAIAVRPAVPLVVACATMGAASVGFVIAVAPLRAMGLFGRYSVLIGVRSILGLPGALLGAAAFGVPGAILGLYGPQLLLLPFARSPGTHRTTLPLSRALRYGIPVSTMNVAASLLSIADRYVLSLSQPIGLVGIYVATYVTMEQCLRFVPSAASAAIAPTVYRALAAGDRSTARRILTGTTVLTVAADVAILVILIAFSSVWLPILGKGFGIADVIVVPLGLGMAAHAANQILAVRYSALEQVGGLAVNVWIAVATNIALNIVLDPTYGVVAAAWATAVSYGLLLLLNVGQALMRPGLSSKPMTATLDG